MALAALVATLLGAAFAIDIGISPGRVNLNAQPGETVTTTVDVITGAGATQQIAVDVSDWTLDAAGDLVLLPVGQAGGAGAWITPEADAFEIAGGTSRPFRVSVTVPDRQDVAGTYPAMVLFAVVPPASAREGVAVVTTTQIAFTVYVTIAGTETSGSRLSDMYFDPDAGIVLTIANEGNTVMRLGGRVELRDETGAVRYTLPLDDVPVLRESEQDVSVALPPDVEPGFYVALALVEDSRGGLLTGQTQLELP